MPRFSVLIWMALSAVCAQPCAHAALTQRWSFNHAASAAPSGTTIADSVAGTLATVRGNGATLNGSAIVLPGTTTGNQNAQTVSAYLDLPNGLISSRTHLSVEIWATPITAKAWQRLFDFGNMTGAGDGLGATGEWTGGLTTAPGTTTASDEFALTLAVNSDLNTHRLYGRLNYAAPSTGNYYIESTLATTAGQRHHYVVTFENGAGTYGSAGARQTWYRNGIQVGIVDVPWQLSQLNDVNNWIGRSQFSGDNLANASFDEIRLYNHVLSVAEITANTTAGPDSIVTPPAPVTAPTPDHRWVFNQQADSTVDPGLAFTDDFAGLVATLRGNGAALTGTSLRLPGTTDGNQTAATISAYLDLPNGLISAQPSITLEAWVTPLSSKNWQRLFDFGRCVTTSGVGAAAGEIIDGSSIPGATAGYDNIGLTLNTGTNLNSQQLEGQYDGNAPVFTSTTAATSAGTEYHYVFVIEDGVGVYGASGSQLRWYRNSALQNSMDLPFRTASMEDVNNWIGRSLYSADSNSNFALNELRIYRRALTAGQVVASYTAGADPGAGEPEALPPARSLKTAGRLTPPPARPPPAPPWSTPPRARPSRCAAPAPPSAAPPSCSPAPPTATRPPPPSPPTSTCPTPSSPNTRASPSRRGSPRFPPETGSASLISATAPSPAAPAPPPVRSSTASRRRAATSPTTTSSFHST